MVKLNCIRKDKEDEICASTSCLQMFEALADPSVSVSNIDG